MNTSPPAERVESLKPFSEIENNERPECMQNITLPDWAAWYDSCGKKCYRKTNEKTDFVDLPIENKDGLNDHEVSNYTSDVIPTISKSIKKRSQASIIRSVWFNREA